MTWCERMRDAAPGLAALPPGDPERLAAEGHAASCPACARALEEGARLQSLLAELTLDPLPVGAALEAARAIKEELAREGRRRVVGSLVAIGASFVLLVTLAHQRSQSPSDLALAAALAVAAVGLGALAGRFTLGAVSAALIAALAAALIGGKASAPLEASMGVHCLASELLAAGAVLCAVRIALAGSPTSPPFWAFAAGAAAGALAADAALEVTCGARESLAHLLVFHLGGVVLAVALARLALRRPRLVDTRGP